MVIKGSLKLLLPRQPKFWLASLQRSKNLINNHDIFASQKTKEFIFQCHESLIWHFIEENFRGWIKVFTETNGWMSLLKQYYTLQSHLKYVRVNG